MGGLIELLAGWVEDLWWCQGTAGEMLGGVVGTAGRRGLVDMFRISARAPWTVILMESIHFGRSVVCFRLFSSP